MTVVNNTAAAQAIAAAFEAGRLDHPGDKDSKLPPATLALPMFRLNGRPPVMADSMRDNLKVMSEAIVCIIEQQLDCSIVPNSELAELRTGAPSQ